MKRDVWALKSYTVQLVSRHKSTILILLISTIINTVTITELNDDHKFTLLYWKFLSDWNWSDWAYIFQENKGFCKLVVEFNYITISLLGGWNILDQTATNFLFASIEIYSNQTTTISLQGGFNRFRSNYVTT